MEDHLSDGSERCKSRSVYDELREHKLPPASAPMTCVDCGNPIHVATTIAGESRDYCPYCEAKDGVRCSARVAGLCIERHDLLLHVLSAAKAYVDDECENTPDGREIRLCYDDECVYCALVLAVQQADDWRTGKPASIVRCRVHGPSDAFRGHTAWRCVHCEIKLMNGVNPS